MAKFVEACIVGVAILSYLFLTLAVPLLVINRPSSLREEEDENPSESL